MRDRLVLDFDFVYADEVRHDILSDLGEGYIDINSNGGWCRGMVRLVQWEISVIR